MLPSIGRSSPDVFLRLPSVGSAPPDARAGGAEHAVPRASSFSADTEPGDDIGIEIGVGIGIGVRIGGDPIVTQCSGNLVVALVVEGA
jgi:hypothetical protein